MDVRSCMDSSIDEVKFSADQTLRELVNSEVDRSCHTEKNYSDLFYTKYNRESGCFSCEGALLDLVFVGYECDPRKITHRNFDFLEMTVTNDGYYLFAEPITLDRVSIEVMNFLDQNWKGQKEKPLFSIKMIADEKLNSIGPILDEILFGIELFYEDASMRYFKVKLTQLNSIQKNELACNAPIFFRLKPLRHH
jgi:hypothetical protein